MSSGCSSNRNKIFVVLLTLAALVFLNGNAYARNPDLSNWTINLSGLPGDEPPGERWDDAYQEIVVVGSTVHVLWWAVGYSISERLYYRRSTDGGQTWQAKILLFDTAPLSGNRDLSGQKYLAVDGTSVHVAYNYTPASGYWNIQLMYRRSTDNGASFEDARPLAGPYSSIVPTYISASGGGVTIAMTYGDPTRNFDPYVAMLNSADNGDTFTFRDVDTWGGKGMTIRVDDLKRVGNRVYLLYRKDLIEGGYYTWSKALYCAASLDGGATFKVNQMTTPAADGNYLTHQIQSNSYSPNVAVDGDRVQVVWTQRDTSANATDNSLYIRRSADQGQNFAAPQLLAQNGPDVVGNIVPGLETVAANGGYVYVILLAREALGGGQYNDRVYFRRSADSGASFSPIQQLVGLGWWPNMVVDPANGAIVHVFSWSTYRYSADGGASFTNPVVLMPWNGIGSNWGGTQMALGPEDSKHFVTPLSYNTSAYGGGDLDIFYRRYGPVPAPSGRGALKTYSSTAEGRFDSMEVATSDWFNFGSRMSAEVWLKPSPKGPYWRPVLAKLSTAITPTANPNRLFSIGTESRGTVSPYAVAELATTAGWYVLTLGESYPAGLVPENAWTHLAMTYDADAGPNNFKLYKNGQVIASRTATGTVATGTGNFFAGSPWESGGWELSELRLWSKALSQVEINANMRLQLSGSEAGLNAYYPFSHTTKDMTGHGNDGILIYKESYVPPPSFSGAMPAVNSLLMQ